MLDLVDWPEFERRVGAEHAAVTRDHAGRSIAASIDRARDVLGYRPRYSSLDALYESLRWLVANGQVDVIDAYDETAIAPVVRKPDWGGGVRTDHQRRVYRADKQETQRGRR